MVIASRKLDACERAAAEVRESTGRGAVPSPATSAGGTTAMHLVDETLDRFGGWTCS